MNKRIKITSLFLATILTVSGSGCSIKRTDSSNNVNAVSIEEKRSREKDYQDKMINFINKVESSNIGINMKPFYENAKTLKIIFNDKVTENYYNSFYDRDQNIIFVNIDEDGAFEHELIHVIMNNKENISKKMSVFLEEGYTELLSSELCDSGNTYRFNVGLMKILSKIIGSENIVEAFNNYDLDKILVLLSNIKPYKEDAKEVIEHLDYEHILCNKMHQDFFKNGNINNFKNSEDYIKLKNVRSDLIKRFKIYIKAYYDSVIYDDNVDSQRMIIDMIAILDIVNNDLFDKDIEIVKGNDFFLKEEINYLMKKYNYTGDQYNDFVLKSKSIKFFINENNCIKKEKTN